MPPDALRTIATVSPPTQALLYALLGAVLGGGVVLAWRVSEAQHRPVVAPEPTLQPGVAAVLSVLRSSALVVGTEDTVLKASAPAVAMGLVSGQRIAVPDLARLVAEVRRDGQIRETELVIRRTGGLPPRHVSTRVAPLGAQLVLALAEDRTREHRVESIRRDFVANVSHELKTPVGAIRLLSDAVSDAAGDVEAVRRFAARMQVESERLGRLVQQVIELSRLQGDDPLDEPAAVQVDTLVERALDEVATDADARHLTVAHDGAKGLVVLGNEEQLSLALNNLVANAVKYSADESTVVVSTRVTADGVEVAVTDQGVGIPPDELDRIFERFYRVDPARHRSTGGTGIGLSIVKHVVASHGGDVRVWSVEGQGSTFTMSLPRGTTGAAIPPEEDT
jgi:two-component system sensor histidine kinase SenX3